MRFAIAILASLIAIAAANNHRGHGCKDCHRGDYHHGGYHDGNYHGGEYRDNCDWPGHCYGASCRRSQDCWGELVCRDNYCRVRERN